MAVRKPRQVRPVDAALTRLMDLAGKGAAPGRMAREVQLIADAWIAAPEADRAEIRDRLDELRTHLQEGVGYAEEQMADLDASEAGALKQASAMLAALVATRDTAAQIMRSFQAAVAA